MKTAIKLVQCTLIVLFFSGCNPIKDHLNTLYPPISHKDQQQTATASLIRNVSHLELPSLSIGVEIKDLEDLIIKGDGIDPSVRSIKLKGGEQILDIEIGVDKTFTQKDWANNPDIKRILKEARINVVAKLKISVTLTSVIETSVKNQTIFKLRMLPVVNGIKFTETNVSGIENTDMVVDVASKAFQYIVNNYADNITGYLSKLDVMETTIPLDVINYENKSKIISSKLGQGQLMTVNLASNKWVSPIKVKGHAVLIDKKSIMALVELVPTDADNSPTLVNKPSNYKEAKQVFLASQKSVFDNIHLKANTWAAVSKEVIALTMNNGLKEVSACFSADTPIPRENFSEKISPPDWEGIDCDSKRECKQTRNCSFAQQTDRRNCNACLLRAPRVCLPDTPFGKGSCSGGQCVQRGNDPVCEAAKGAQNILYATDHAAKTLDCNRIKEQNRLTCEAEKAVEINSCKIGKEIVKRVALTGNIANINGHVRGDAKANMCISDIAVTNDLSSIKMDFSLKGEANVKGKLEFVPLDIIGHGICYMPADAPLNFIASIPKKNQQLDLGLEFVERDGKFGVNFSTNKLKFDMNLTPSPTEWILTNVDMAIKCPGLNLLKPLVITATPFVPELRGIAEYEQPETEHFIKLDLPAQKVNGVAVKTRISANDKAIFLEVIK